MIDVIRILSATILGYALFLGTILLLVKIFFPFVDKKELKEEA